MTVSLPSFITEPGAELALDLGHGRLQRGVLGLGVLGTGLDRGWLACCHVQITSSAAPSGRQFESCQGRVASALGPELRTVESDPDGTERMSRPLGQRRQALDEPPPPLSAAGRAAHPGDAQMRPEAADARPPARPVSTSLEETRACSATAAGSLDAEGDHARAAPRQPERLAAPAAGRPGPRPLEVPPAPPRPARPRPPRGARGRPGSGAGPRGGSAAARRDRRARPAASARSRRGPPAGRSRATNALIRSARSPSLTARR